jgi:hypothetical protein
VSRSSALRLEAAGEVWMAMGGKVSHTRQVVSPWASIASWYQLHHIETSRPISTYHSGGS